MNRILLTIVIVTALFLSGCPGGITTGLVQGLADRQSGMSSYEIEMLRLERQRARRLQLDQMIDRYETQRRQGWDRYDTESRHGEDQIETERRHRELLGVLCGPIDIRRLPRPGC